MGAEVVKRWKGGSRFYLQKIMNKIMSILEKPLGKFSFFLTTNRFTSAVIHGITISIPVTIIGGLATLITAAPDPSILAEGNIFRGVLDAWAGLAAGGLGSFSAIVNNVTMNMLAVYCLLAITYKLADSFALDKMTSCVTSLILFLMIACTFDNGMSMGFLGGRGLFFAIFVSCLSVWISHLLIERNIKISLPDSVPPNIAAPFEQLIPLVVNIVVFYLLNWACVSLSGTIIPQFIMDLFAPLLIASDSLPAMLIYAFLLNALWIIGVNGGNIVNSVMSSVLLINLSENAAAYAAGEEMTHIFCYSPNTAIMNPGGSGSALALVIAALIVARSEHLKAITRIGGAGTIFNISEPIVYGYPIVLNVHLFLPFILVPMLNTTVWYLLMDFDIIGKMFINVPWVLPTPIQLFLATLDWKTIIVWIVLIAVNVIIYIPFVKMYDKHLLKEQESTVQENEETTKA